MGDLYTMKRLITAALSATLGASCLAGFYASPADAVGPYPGTVDTFTKVSVARSTIHQGQKETICVTVGTAGSGKPKGTVSIEVESRDGGSGFGDSSSY